MHLYSPERPRLGDGATPALLVPGPKHAVPSLCLHPLKGTEVLVTAMLKVESGGYAWREITVDEASLEELIRGYRYDPEKALSDWFHWKPSDYAKPQAASPQPLDLSVLDL